MARPAGVGAGDPLPAGAGDPSPGSAGSPRSADARNPNNRALDHPGRPNAYSLRYGADSRALESAASSSAELSGRPASAVAPARSRS
jgi:hypothetical protein